MATNYQQKSIRDAGKDVSNALHALATQKGLSGRPKSEFVLTGLAGAIEGLRLASNPDRPLIAHLEIMYDALGEALGPKQRRQSGPRRRRSIEDVEAAA